jgi:hypothetical protein
MKVYDVVLAWIRALVVLDLIRELSTFGYLSVRVLAFLRFWQYPATRTELLADFASPAIGIVVSLIIFAASRPIARFAARFANDAASHF